MRGLEEQNWGWWRHELGPASGLQGPDESVESYWSLEGKRRNSLGKWFSYYTDEPRLDRRCGLEVFFDSSS
jgi:hypothetical protein